MSSPDYCDMTAEDALNDFLQRIQHYVDQYQPLDEAAEDHLSFMKIYNTGVFIFFAVSQIFNIFIAIFVMYI